MNAGSTWMQYEVNSNRRWAVKMEVRTIHIEQG